MLPEAALAAGLWPVFLPAFLAAFAPGPAPIFGWPEPVLETVVVSGWPVVREPERKGKIAYTIRETIATTATVSREPMTRARAERKTLSRLGRRKADR